MLRIYSFIALDYGVLSLLYNVVTNDIRELECILVALWFNAVVAPKLLIGCVENCSTTSVKQMFESQ